MTVPDSTRSETFFYVCIIAVIASGLYLSSLHSYILFHSLIEITTISIGFTLFILTWNARQILTYDCLKILGIGYAFISLIDLLHTLAYKGMNIFPGFGANLPTQLWIAARYLQAITLCTAPLFVERKVDKRVVFEGYAIAASLLVAAVYSGYFPDCFIEGKGLTVFKIGSEYVISALLFVSLYLFYRKRSHFSTRVFLLTASSIACTIISELSFSAYLSVYGFANMVGHFSKLAAFYLIYRAILVTGLKEPFELIFRDLKKAEEALEKSRDTLEEKVVERTTALENSIAELQRAQEQLHLQAVELEEEIAERQSAQETLQDQAILLENEIEERRHAQDELEKLNETLEQHVQARTAELEEKNRELERFNKLFVGRELMMIKLKERIKELENLASGQSSA